MMQTTTETGEKEDRFKIVVVGNDATGKTSLFNVFTGNDYPKGEKPLTEYHYVDVYLKEKNEPVKLSMLCGPDDETLDVSVKSELYSNCHSVIICFSLIDYNSIYAVESRWVEEARQHCGSKIPIILVGCKKDLRDKEEESKVGQLTVELENTSNKLQQMLVSRLKGESLAKEINANNYLECSIITRDGVNETLGAVAKAAMIYKTEMCNDQQATELENDERDKYDLCVYNDIE